MHKLPIEIHAINLHKYWDQEKELAGFLDENEIKRAYQYKFDYLRKNYIISHALLRLFIAQSINTHPKNVSFFYGPFGKPFLQGYSLYFNMSHSKHMVLYAFSQGGEIGVDIEYMDPDLSIDRLPISVLPPHIQEEIRSFPSSEQKEAFYRKWVQLEAYLKAIGLGLHTYSCQSNVINFPQWSFYDVPLPEEYIGTVAYEAFPYLAEISLKNPIPKIKEAINIDIPPTKIGIL